MSHDDFAFEPIPGLPGTPPRGETLLWQGRPTHGGWRSRRTACGGSWVVCRADPVARFRGGIAGGAAGGLGLWHPLPPARRATGLIIWLLAFAQARAHALHSYHPPRRHAHRRGAVGHVQRALRAGHRRQP